MRIIFNAPVSLSLVFGSLGVLALAVLEPEMVTRLLASPSSLKALSLGKLLTLFVHVLGHTTWQHFAGNAFFILLIGPAVEEKYGSGVILLLTLTTALLTSLLSALLFSSGLMGASGIVFMLIILNSITSVREGEIPLSFILVAVFFLGHELVQAFKDDGTSRFAHILGGCFGGVAGLVFNRRKTSAPVQTGKAPGMEGED